MTTDTVPIRPERASDQAAIAALHQAVFPPDAYQRTAFKVRAQAPHILGLSFLTERDGALIGSVRMTPIGVGAARGLFLGPLAVDPPSKGRGFGKALMRRAVEEAAAAGWPFIILVGDHPYYWPFGFNRLPEGRVLMPGPVDPNRLLAAELIPGSVEQLDGLIVGLADARDRVPLTP